MGKVIDLSERKQRKAGQETENLTEMLKKAACLSKNLTVCPDELFGVTPEEFKRIMEVNLSHGILQERRIDFAAFRCGLYAADVMAQMLSQVPSWCGHDYLVEFQKEKDPAIFRKGGDAFLFMCSLFPEKGDWVEMKLSDYLDIGRRFYGFYYFFTSREIGFYMKKYFLPTVNLVRKYALNFSHLPFDAGRQ